MIEVRFCRERIAQEAEHCFDRETCGSRTRQKLVYSRIILIANETLKADIELCQLLSAKPVRR